MAFTPSKCNLIRLDSGEEFSLKTVFCCGLIVKHTRTYSICYFFLLLVAYFFRHFLFSAFFIFVSFFILFSVFVVKTLLCCGSIVKHRRANVADERVRTEEALPLLNCAKSIFLLNSSFEYVESKHAEKEAYSSRSFF